MTSQTMTFFAESFVSATRFRLTAAALPTPASELDDCK